MKQRIRRICPKSLAYTCAVIYFFIGIITGSFGIIGGLSGASMTLKGPIAFSGSGGPLLLVSMSHPFISALAGAIVGYLVAIFYNFSVRFTKGVTVDIELDESNQSELNR